MYLLGLSEIVRTLLALKWPLLVCAIAAAIGTWLIWSLFPGAGISVIVPDDNTFEISKPGRYTVWTQVEVSSQGKLMTFATGLPPGVTIVISRPNGTTIPLHSSVAPLLTRHTARTIQVVIGDITFDSPGSYRIAVDGLHEKRALYLESVRYAVILSQGVHSHRSSDGVSRLHRLGRRDYMSRKDETDLTMRWSERRTAALQF